MPKGYGIGPLGPGAGGDRGRGRCRRRRRVGHKTGRRGMKEFTKLVAVVEKKRCTRCGACLDACPVNAITLNDTAEIDKEICTGCGLCVEKCPHQAITMKKIK